MVLAIVAISTTTLVSLNIKEKPVIEEVIPPIGEPGDIITITGKHFGKSRDTNYVEIGGSRITASAYISWNDNEIKLTVPVNINNGLVFVGNGKTRSEPSFFANENNIPRLAQANTQTTKPSVATVAINGASATPIAQSTSLRIKTGDLLIISGTNFGNTNDNAEVLFSSSRITNAQSQSHGNIEEADDMIHASRNDFDYVYWNDTEIRVYVPDGISDGNFYIKTAHGTSLPIKITNSSSVGKKTFPTQKTYLIEITANISDVVSEPNTTITLRMPRPQKTAAQPRINMTESSPAPTIADFQHTLIFQAQIAKSPSMNFKTNFVLPVYEIATEINPDKIGSYDKMNPVLRAIALQEDACVPSKNEKVIELATQIVGRERNAYRKAKRIYDYMLSNYSITQGTRSGDASPVDLMENNIGDAYDFAVLFTALLRASDIPALPCSGILVDRSMDRQPHWWAEFYLPEFGWLPADPALGAGLPYNAPGELTSEKDYYFGNLDAQHILFSRGYNEIKPASASSVTVQIPRSYALQAIWEEANVPSISYSSFWNIPQVLGVY